MARTTDSPPPRRSAGHATAAVLFGAGLACAGHAQANTESLASDPPEPASHADVAVAMAVDMTALPAAVELPAERPAEVATQAEAAVPTVPGVMTAPAHAVLGALPKAQPAPAPARVLPVDKASVAKHHPAQEPLAAAMTLATREPVKPVSDARKQMAGWKPVAEARLEESRGGFDAGGLQVGFGIDRAVFVNGALAVSTSITIPDISAITAAQATQLAQALGHVTVAVNAANSAANAAVASAQAAAAAAQGAAGQAGQAATTAANGASAAAQGAAGTASSTASAAAAGASAIAAGASGAAQQAVASAGTIVTNGLLTVIQNGAGNSANMGAVSNMPGTVIQNNLNNQNIQSLMTLNASVNTLAAFRSQMANTALNSVMQRSAALR
ncbi:hypothetical protein [Cupriavidus sp. H18C2]|uniref:hypothetical protein n=1 Tax=Cupriavidus sp. H18C2 TaxID=3241602 RepID=UPI003BF85310